MNRLRISGDDFRTGELLARHFQTVFNRKENVPAETLIVCSLSEEDLAKEAVRCSKNGTRLIWITPFPSGMRRELAKIAPAETETRFIFPDSLNIEGISGDGISGEFYPAVLPECSVPVILNRRGELPFETAQVWLDAHRNGTSLRYPAFGGCGKQVIDLLAEEDFLKLVEKELEDPECGGKVLHVSGGMRRSVSLLELTSVCETISGRTIRITDDERLRGSVPPVLVGDIRKTEKLYHWKPEKTLEEIMETLERKNV